MTKNKSEIQFYLNLKIIFQKYPPRYFISKTLTYVYGLLFLVFSLFTFLFE
jgi:hypothetical protein